MVENAKLLAFSRQIVSKFVQDVTNNLAQIYWQDFIQKNHVKLSKDTFTEKNGGQKGNRTIADLRYEGKDITSHSTLIFAPIKS